MEKQLREIYYQLLAVEKQVRTRRRTFWIIGILGFLMGFGAGYYLWPLIGRLIHAQ